jgi:4-hydroxythreonine-4-phosphate dehydrogenase
MPLLPDSKQAYTVEPVMAQRKSNLPIAITQGDPAGIGPEIIAMLYKSGDELLQGTFVVGHEGVLRRALQVVGATNLTLHRINDPSEVLVGDPRQIYFLEPSDENVALPVFAQINAQAGRMAAQSVIWAADAALQGEVGAIVTAPLHKEALHAAGIDFPGHTELLQARAAIHAGVSQAQMPVRMMLANRELRTVLVSIHISMRQAIEAVTIDNILETLRITHQAEMAILGRKPHIAVAGLNPHAGEGGLMGSEEIEIIAPAIALAQKEGVHATGPYPPDTVFMRARAKKNQSSDFDVVVSMYHDQGLIPIKYMGVEQGVNVTLGLPLIRTSPDHGTAFDLAGRGVADPSSLREALWMAKRLLTPTLLV